MGVGNAAVSGEAIEAERRFTQILKLLVVGKSDIVIAERCVNRLASGKQSANLYLIRQYQFTFNVVWLTLRPNQPYSAKRMLRIVECV